MKENRAFDVAQQIDMFSLSARATAFWLTGQRHQVADIHVCPGQAIEAATQYNYVNQRQYSRQHVLVLAEAMKRGEFREYTPIDFAVLDGVPHLVNGQHTLRAISHAGSPFWLSVHFHRVEDVSEIDALYSKYDIGKTRNIRDALHGIGDELGLTVKEREGLATAVNFINMGFRIYSGNDDPVRIFEAKDFEVKKRLMREWAEEAKLVFAEIAPAPGFNKQLFLRGAILAVALVTMRYQPDLAKPFWSGAAIDDGLRNGDPRKAFVNWLRNNKVGTSMRFQHRAAIASWNAWFSGRTLSKVYPATEAALKIAGTAIEILSKK